LDEEVKRIILTDIDIIFWNNELLSDLLELCVKNKMGIGYAVLGVLHFFECCVPYLSDVPRNHNLRKHTNL